MNRGGPWLKRGSLSCAAGFMAALWTGLVLAELDRFSLWPALCAAVIAGGSVWRHLGRTPTVQTSCVAMPRSLLAAVALAMLSLTFTLPPSEVILGGWDPGVYVHTAAVLARDGSLRPECPDLAALDTADRALIGRQGHDAWEPFLGMRMLPDGRLSPQFYHLYPVLMALAWPFGGVRAALVVNPLLNAVCIGLMYLWACRWVRPRWAFGAALLLALNPAQVWQAGFSTAELLAQCLLLVGLVLTDRALTRQPNDPMDAVMAGAAFGLTMLARYDAMLFVVPFALVLLTGLREKPQRRQLTILLGTTAVLGLHVWIHQVNFSPFYYPMGNLVVPGLVAAGVGALAIGAVSVLFPRRGLKTAAAAPVWLTGLRVAAVAGFLVWVFLNWYVRPRLAVDGRVATLFAQFYPRFNEAGWFPLVAGRNARNFWYLRSIFGGAGLAAALAGVGILIVRTRTTWRAAWLVASLAVLTLLMTLISHEPFMMFVSRRLVPVIIPLLCLGLATLGDRLEWALRATPRRAALLAAVVLGLPLLATSGNTAYLAVQREWPGLTDWYDELATRIPPGARVYSDAPGFAAPLRFLHGIQACEVNPLAPGRPADPMGMMRKQSESQAVFWLTEFPLPEAYAAYAMLAATLPLHSRILGSAPHTVPRHVRLRVGTFTLYSIAPHAGSRTGSAAE